MRRGVAVLTYTIPRFTPRRSMSNDAIVLLKKDHKEIRKVFADFENAGKDAHKTKGKIVHRIIELLTVHTYIENESYEEHHVADVLVMELYGMAPDAARFDAKTTVLIENVRHHIEEEEDEWFPKVRDGLGRKALQEIGEELLAAKKKAPREPSQPSALKKTIDAVIS
jgi:hemerythrin-like domain-containing protein